MAGFSELAAHTAVALQLYMKKKVRDGRQLPRELAEITTFLAAASQVPAPARTEPQTLPDPLRKVDGSGMKLLLTTREAAHVLGLGVRTVEAMVSDGRLPSVTEGRARRIRTADLEMYVESLNPLPARFTENIEIKAPNGTTPAPAAALPPSAPAWTYRVPHRKEAA